MSDYAPPRENVPIFDTTLFGPRVGSFNTGGGSGGGGSGGDCLTKAEADELYLKWPSGQSTPSGETMNGPTFMTSLLQVAGATTMSNTASVALDLTAGQDIIMNTAGSYIRFPDLTQQTTGFIPIVPPIPVGTYANSTITVNSFGQVISASSGSGGGGIITQTFITLNNPLPLNTPYPVVVPAGTNRLKIIACSGGGQQGANFLNTTTNTMYAGGSGGAGSMVICNFDLTALPYSFSGNLLSVIFTDNISAGQGDTASINWSSTALAYYGGFLPQSTLGNGNICTVYGGLAGGNASDGVAGSAGVNPAIGDQIKLSGANMSLITVYAQGQNGSSLAPFTYGTAVAQSMPTCPMADYNPVGTTLNTYIRGGYSTYTTTPSVNAISAGSGGFVITFYA